MKTRPPRPTRGWEKTAGPGLVMRMAAAMRAMTGASSRRSVTEPMTSTARFTRRSHGAAGRAGLHAGSAYGTPSGRATASEWRAAADRGERLIRREVSGASKEEEGGMARTGEPDDPGPKG